MITEVAALVMAAVLLQQAPPATGAKRQGSFDDSRSASPDSLHSVGIRGSVDAGGYAASANARTQSNLFQQLADLQVGVLLPALLEDKSCSDSASVRRRAMRALSDGELSAAAKTLEASVKTEGESAASRQLLGLAYEGEGHLESAAEQFRLAAEKRSDDASHFAYGAALLLIGDMDRAAKVFGNGGGLLAELGLGVAQFQSGRANEAVRTFINACSKQKQQTAPFRLAAAALSAADAATLADATKRLALLTQDASANPGAHFAYATALTVATKSGEGDANSGVVEKELKRAIELDSNLAEARIQLASLLAVRGDNAAAAGHYEAALRSDGSLADAHYRLGQLYTRLGKHEEARQQLKIHQSLRDRQKADIESGKVPLRLKDFGAIRRPMACP